MDYKKIGEYITQKRKKLNYTQKEVADKLCLTDRAISRWERGIGCPDISYLEELANILNVSVLEILHGEDIKDSVEENKTVVKLMTDNKKKINKLKIGFSISLNILLIFLIVLIVFIAKIGYNENKAIGNNYQYIKILSSSMKPELDIYDIVKIKKVNSDDDLYIGNTITFYLHTSDNQELLTTHRIVDKYQDEETGKTYYKTRGINNPTNDYYDITLNDVVGKVTKKIKLSFLIKNNYLIFFLLLLVYLIVVVDVLIVVMPIKKKCVK